MTIWRTLDTATVSIGGMADDDLSTARSLLSVWQSRLPQNMKRSLYRDGEKGFDKSGIYMPEHLRNASFYLGWAGMAVRKASVRSQFDGFRLPGSDDPFELAEVLDENNFSMEFSQGTDSAYTHGPAFVTVTPDEAMRTGVQIQGHTAENAAAIWDYRTRLVSSGLTISGYDDDERPTDFTLYLPGRAIRVMGEGEHYRVADVSDLPQGRAPMVPLTYDPGLSRPFGHSRITRPVMALTDMAIRAYVRMEKNAELYSWPQLAIEAADPDAFEGVGQERRMQLAMDRIIAISKDADGDKPVIKQFQQATMEPHNSMLRTVAMAFSGETGIPPSSLGIVHDQPASAEAIRANEHDLLIDVGYQNKYTLQTAAKRIAELAVMVRDGLSSPPEGIHRLSAAFIDPEFRSTSAKADAAIKLAQIPDVAESPVLLEEVFDQDKVERILEDRRRRQAGSSALSLVSDSGSAKRNREDAEALRLKADTLGLLRRAGVSAESAARQVGLEGVEFIPGNPITIRSDRPDANEG